MSTDTKTLDGGEFLVKDITAQEIFSIEELSEEQKMLRDSAKEFIDKEVVPNKERFEKKDKKKGCCLEREWREERERERERKRKEDQKVPKRNVHVPRAAFTAGEDGHE